MPGAKLAKAAKKSVYDNPHSLTNCNGCGKKLDPSVEAFVSPIDAAEEYDGGVQVGHQRPVCKECYRKEWATEYPNAQCPV